MSRLAVIVKGWPRLSETFVAQELVGLEERGLTLDLWSLRHPTDAKTHALHKRLKATVRYLPEYLKDEPARVWRGWRTARALPGYAAARAVFLADLRRDRTPNRARRFFQACVLAAEMDGDSAHLYAHFIHTPGSVARYAALMRGLSWSAFAHAKDIWTTPDWEKREKLAAMAWCATCTKAGAEHLEALGPGKTRYIPHGLDVARWPAAPIRAARSPVTIVSVGRLVPKKGYDDLIAALIALDPALDWRFVHIGGGPLKDAIKAQAASLGGRVEFRGPGDQDAVLAALREADVFALASKTADDGDRDGLPNVLMEAASQDLPIVATQAGSIGDFLDASCGIAVAPGDRAGLAAALTRLIADPALRARLGQAAGAKVRREFPFAANCDLLYALLSTCVLPSTRP
ncbi:MAG: glycosyltransferase family 4 protein [Tagaea sp.]|nr:glycosyltransferase family 4 protein [Tagaea sp.]